MLSAMLSATFNKPHFPIAGLIIRKIKGEPGTVCLHDAWSINAFGEGEEQGRPEESIVIIGRHSEDPSECDDVVKEIKREFGL